MYALAATLLWSVVPVGIKHLLHEGMHPFFIAFSRFAMASGVLWLAARTREGVQPLTRAEFPILLMGGLGMAGNYILYALGLRFTTASATNIIVQNEVVILVVLSHFVLAEKIGWAKTVGMLLAIAGIVVVFWNGQSMHALLSSKHLVGNAIIFLAGLSWPFYGLAQKMLSRRSISNTNALMYIFGFAAIFTAVPTLIHTSGNGLHIAWSFPVALWLFVVGVVSTALGYLLLARAFDRLTASTVGVVTCMLPIFTLVIARLFLLEPLTASIAAGAALVVGGMVLIGREEAVQPDREHRNHNPKTLRT